MPCGLRLAPPDHEVDAASPLGVYRRYGDAGIASRHVEPFLKPLPCMAVAAPCIMRWPSRAATRSLGMGPRAFGPCPFRGPHCGPGGIDTRGYALEVGISGGPRLRGGQLEPSDLRHLVPAGTPVPGEHQHDGGRCRDHGGHAYVASGSSGLCVVDISDPHSPAVVGCVDTPGGRRKG